jgi:hypothetical protein
MRPVEAQPNCNTAEKASVTPPDQNLQRVVAALDFLPPFSPFLRLLNTNNIFLKKKYYGLFLLLIQN